mgnify:CR=1 FL=1
MLVFLGFPVSYRNPIENIQKERSCTDFFCYILFFAFSGFMVYALFDGMAEGDLSNLAQPYDVDSNACGKGA